MRKRILVVLLSVTVMFTFMPAYSAYADSWWHDDDGTWYYLDDYGYVQYGWRHIGGSWYFFDYPDGDMLYGGLWWVDGVPYYFTDDGKMRTGWIREAYTDEYGYAQEDWYYADSSGVLQQGWRKIGGKWYYFAHEDEVDSGSGCWMCAGDVYKIGGTLYAFDVSGALRYGWTKYNQSWGDYEYDYNLSYWVYSDSSGVVKTGWQKIGGTWYYFNSWGMMAENEWVKDSAGWCYLGSNGKMLTNSWARDSVGWVWLNGSGRITKSSWIKYNGDWYYLKANGYMATGTQTIGGKTYTFDSSGRML